MGAAYFYHLTESPLEAVLPVLSAKASQAGWRVLLRCATEEQVVHLDLSLWINPAHSFLPHGVSGGKFDSDQPVLLTADAFGCADFECLISVGGAQVTADEIAGLARAMVLFDGFDPEAVARARSQWKTTVDAGVEAQYWAQNDGRWEMKAQS